MKYKYRNDKHVILHGIPPGEIKEFNEKIEGGGITFMNDASEEDEQKPSLLQGKKIKTVKTIRGGE